MSQKGVEGLLGRMVTDADFRRRFCREPAAVCLAEAMEVTTRELEAVLALDEVRVAEFTKRLDARIVRASASGGGPASRELAKGKRSTHGRSGERPVVRVKQPRTRYERRPA